MKQFLASLFVFALLTPVAALAGETEAALEKAPTKTVAVKVTGETCRTCTMGHARTLMRISRVLKKVDGVQSTTIEASKSRVLVTFDTNKVSSVQIGDALVAGGQQVTQLKKLVAKQ